MIAADATPGARVRAPWGSTYRVHRTDGATVVLADVDRPSAFVLRAIDRLGRGTARRSHGARSGRSRSARSSTDGGKDEHREVAVGR